MTRYYFERLEMGRQRFEHKISVTSTIRPLRSFDQRDLKLLNLSVLCNTQNESNKKNILSYNMLERMYRRS